MTALAIIGWAAVGYLTGLLSVVCFITSARRGDDTGEQIERQVAQGDCFIPALENFPIHNGCLTEGECQNHGAR